MSSGLEFIQIADGDFDGNFTFFSLEGLGHFVYSELIGSLVWAELWIGRHS